MKPTFGPLSDHFEIGIYLNNWNAPLKPAKWELGIYLVKWYVGIQFFKGGI